MSDEQPKNVQSVPPPATDEIDQDWGATPAPPGAATKSSSGQEKPVKATATKPLPAKSASKDESDDDDDDDDESDDDESDDETEDGDESDEDDDDESDEDDDDESDGEDEKADVTPAKAAPRSATKPSTPPGASKDWIPDWAPWVVLGALVTAGLVGGLGFAGRADPRRTEAGAEDSATLGTPSPSPKPTVAATAAAAAMPKPAAGDEESVEASHLLVAYQGGMRAAPTTTRTKEEAKKRAEEALAKAKKGAAFEKLVAEYSDEPGAAARGGKLGAFTRNRMVKPFADAAFALKPGQLSGVVETAFGYHVILRTK